MAVNVQLCLSGPRTPQFSLTDHIRAANEAGFSALDLWAPKLHDALATYPVLWLDIELQKRHVYVTSVSGVKLLTGQTREDILVHEADFLTLCTHLDALGGGTIAVWSGTDAESPRGGTQALSWIVRTLRSYSALAAPFEVRIALDSPAAACEAIYTLKTRQEIVHQVARGNVGLALSIEQLCTNMDGLEEIEALDVSKLWLVRLDAASLQPSESREQAPSEANVQPHPPPSKPEADIDDPSTGEREDRARSEETVCTHLAAKGFRGPYCIAWPTSAAASPQAAEPDSLIDRVRRSRQAALELLALLYP
jgi:2-keto-myo-inositol isomerase